MNKWAFLTSVKGRQPTQKTPTQIKQFAQTVWATFFCLLSAYFYLKGKRGDNLHKLSRNCSHKLCFYLCGWFFWVGRLPTNLYFYVITIYAYCLSTCLLGVIRTIGGIETDARSHQNFPAAIHSYPRRSAAIRGDPNRLFWGVPPGVRLGQGKRSRACLAHPRQS